MTCPGTPPPPELCGRNPVTNSPGMIQTPSGVPGQLRPGKGGSGKFGPFLRDNGHRPHNGVDIAGEIGSDVVASYAGKVLYTGFQEKLAGWFVVVDIGHGLKMMYAHLEEITVKVGDTLDTGVKLGILGQSGNAEGEPASEAHVHFEIYSNDGGRSDAKRYIDPSSFLNNVCPW